MKKKAYYEKKRMFSHFSLEFSLSQFFYAKLKSNHLDAQELKQTDFESKSISLVEFSANHTEVN